MHLIGPRHISAYFQCHRKVYLLINSVEQCEQVDYELLVHRAREKAIETYYEKSGEVQFYKKGLLREGLPVIYDTNIDIQGFNFDGKLLSLFILILLNFQSHDQDKSIRT
jgi:hypothetical protein